MTHLQHGSPASARWTVCVLGACMIALAMSLQACPICDTETGSQVRAGIFDENFWGTLIAVIAPFPVLLLVIAAYYFGFPCLGRRPEPGNGISPASTHNEHYES